MLLIQHIILGVLMGFVGLIPPGLINMTTVRNTLDHGSAAGLKYAAGASLIVLVQASVALVFANYFYTHPEVLMSLKSFGILVFFILSVFFFNLAQKRLKATNKACKSNFFIKGMFMSSMNMLSLPFYLGWSAVLQSKGLLILEYPYILLFVIGASSGAFSLFYLYSMFSKIISSRAHFISKNINYVLSVLFFLLGSMTLGNLLLSS
jgi:threonine/homoserine/homoserine lactone efflux protein